MEVIKMSELDLNYIYYLNIDSRKIHTKDNVFFLKGEQNISKIKVILLKEDGNKLEKYMLKGEVSNYTAKLKMKYSDIETTIQGVLQDDNEATYLFDLSLGSNVVIGTYKCELILQEGNQVLISLPFSFSVKGNISDDKTGTGTGTPSTNIEVSYDAEREKIILKGATYDTTTETIRL